MAYKDPQDKKKWKKDNQYRSRVGFITEEQRLRNNERMKNRGLPHKRIYSDNGGEWICYYCGATREDGVELHIHHKNQNPSDNSFDNLVCLCKRCHLEVVHGKWNNVTIPELIKRGVVDWEGNIKEVTHE